MPVINGVLGKIKNLGQKFQLLPGHRSAIDLQKITLISTAHSILKVLGVNRFDLLWRSGLTGRPPCGK